MKVDDIGADCNSVPSDSVARSRDEPGAVVPGFQNCMFERIMR
jgi:hypothetical protein